MLMHQQVSVDDAANKVKALPDYIRPKLAGEEGKLSCILTGDDYAPAVCALIAGAKYQIKIAQYAITAREPSHASSNTSVYSSLVAAAKRGISCKALLAAHKKYSNTAHFNARAMTSMVEAGWQCRWWPQPRLLHAKVLIVDHVAVVIGSHNIAHTASHVNIDMSQLTIGGSIPVDTSAWWYRLWHVAEERNKKLWP